MVTLLDIATVKQTLRYCTWLLQVTKDAFLQCDCHILKHLLTSLPKFIGETKEKKKKKTMLNYVFTFTDSKECWELVSEELV